LDEYSTRYEFWKFNRFELILKKEKGFTNDFRHWAETWPWRPSSQSRGLRCDLAGTARVGWQQGWRPTSAWAGLGVGLAGATETEGHGGQLRRGSGGPAERAALAMRAGTGTTHGTSERG
jgi:hypothetical protein